ncbi:hypothetical protein BC629DRAFT_1437862 [Irpex lacteus]|nr:hypothetical protein BC629DRAFT_1437862 [Irpex lacteus]
MSDYSDGYDSSQVASMENMGEAAMLALLLYEYCLTLPREITCIWLREFSVASWLFLVNSIITALVYVVNWTRSQYGLHMTAADQMLVRHRCSWRFKFLQSVNESCTITWKVSGSLTIVMYVDFAAFAAIRTYAIWDKDLRVFFIILGLGLIYPAGYAYYIAQTLAVANYPSPSPFTGSGCISASVTLPSALTPEFGAYNLLTVLVALEATSALSFEGITIGLTWVKTVPTIRQIRRDNHRDTLPVTYVIFQDGKCHLFYLTGTLQFMMTSIIVSRFILDLREDHISRSTGEGHGSLHLSDISSVRFGRSTISNESPTPQVLAHTDV